MSHNLRMGGTFTLVVVGAIALFVLVGMISTLSGESLYDRIGEGGLSSESGESRASAPPAGSPDQADEREQEIRQMLKARSDRIVRGGGQALDIDAELAKLQQETAAPESSRHDDAALAEEVRQLVVARNARRARQGQEPLDVEAEVKRTLAELSL